VKSAGSSDEELKDIFPGARLRPSTMIAVDRVIGMIGNPSVSVDLPRDIRGTPFEQKVWAALRAIPANVTTTYATLAGRIGEPKAFRAVASACAANECAVAIPSHACAGLNHFWNALHARRI
jgi:AraC family transcriptional regulator of adaptative response/methylated-DNA-[protein]-cysteine methyltransferase